MGRKRRQLVLMGPAVKGSAAPLGKLADVRAILARHNTSPDGGPIKDSTIAELHGPGLLVELPTSSDPVNQGIITLSDEDTAWPVLMRLMKSQGWRLMDIETGQTLG
jgi:hypothetical protein